MSDSDFSSYKSKEFILSPWGGKNLIFKMQFICRQIKDV